jgi:CheY-like chemotaxis protein
VATKLLVIEDGSNFRAMITSALRRAGYQVVIADTGGMGIAKALKELPDAILLDLSLPDMSGVEVTASLKANPLTRPIPVIICTGCVDEEPKREVLRQGAVEILSKPISPADVNKALRKYLDATFQSSVEDSGSAAAGPARYS